MHIVPQTPLTPGAAYHFTLHAGDGTTVGSWAFQAHQPLRIVATLPEDTQTDVPLTTGIEVTFDQDGVVDPASHFSIKPTVAGRYGDARACALVRARRASDTVDDLHRDCVWWGRGRRDRRAAGAGRHLPLRDGNGRRPARAQSHVPVPRRSLRIGHRGQSDHLALGLPGRAGRRRAASPASDPRHARGLSDRRSRRGDRCLPTHPVVPALEPLFVDGPGADRGTDSALRL